MTTNTSSATILDRATIVSIRVGRLGIRRKVDPKKVKVRQTMQQQIDGEAAADPAPDMIGVSKQLIDSPEYDAIVSLDGKTRSKIAELSLPFGLRAGSYLIADGTLERVDQVLEEWQARRAALVSEFLRVYAAAVAAARAKLGDLYDPADYPHVDDVREAFSVRISYDAWGTPARLETLSQRIYRREQERTGRELRAAAEEVRQGMRVALQQIVSHMVDVLTPGPDGKIKTFRDSTLEHLTGFLDTFAARNIVDDNELSRLVERARDVMSGADPKSIRTAPMVQGIVRSGLTEVRDQLAALVTTPGRRFRFEDGASSSPGASAGA